MTNDNKPVMPPLPQALEINWPELNSQALGCGVEDRSIRDRYQAAEYGFDSAVDKCAECVPAEIYDTDTMRAYGQTCEEHGYQRGLEAALKSLPGGSYCDPQHIADDIRAIAANHTEQAAQGNKEAV